MKKYIKIMIICALIIGLTGCSANNGYALKLENLVNESGDFQFQELAWDSTPSQVEAYLKCELEDMSGVDEIREYKATTFSCRMCRGS